MKYDFDKIIERRGTGAIKTDILKERYGRDDLTALWVFFKFYKIIFSCSGSRLRQWASRRIR